MKFLILIFLSTLLASQSFASTPKKSTSFSTSRDFAATAENVHLRSNLKIKNSGTSSATVYGLYVRQFSYVTPGQSCSSATVQYASSENKSGGAVVMPVTIRAKKTAEVGANYLYNMIYSSIYFLNIISSPPVCALPGCTWGADSTIYNWCIYVGAMAPVSLTGGETSKVAPSSSAVSGGSFNYDLITSYDYIGPITCDDQSMTCYVATNQTQAF